MKINPLPFLPMPGIALAAYVAAGWNSAVAALIVWAAVVTAATLHCWVHARHKRHGDADRGKMIDGVHAGRSAA